MSLDSIVNVEVSAVATSLSRAGFGNMALLACHSFWTERVMKFTSEILDELVDLTVPVTHPIYLMAAAARAQNPAVREFYVLRRTRLPTQIWEFVPTTPVAGEIYEVEVDGTVISVTAGGSPTVATICASLTTALAALADSTATDGTSKVTFTATTAGVLHTLTGMSRNLKFTDVTANPGSGGIAQDLADANSEDPSWYGLQIDSQSKAEILAAALWVEANGKAFMPSTADSAVKDGASTTDVMYANKAANYARTLVSYHPEPQHYFGARWMGKQLPKDPGSTNWAHQQLAANAYPLTGPEALAIKAKNGNYFVTQNSVSSTYWGKTGSGEWIDTTHGSDWMKARTQERIFMLLINSEKVAYTDEGLLALANELRAQIDEGQKAGFLDPKSPIQIVVPTVAEIEAAQKAARNVPGIRGTAKMAGAVNTIDPLRITLTL